MFTVSDRATAAIRQIVTEPGVPRGAGMRIAADGDGISLRIAVSQACQPGDSVIELAPDARIFVAENAEDLLDGRVMDAHKDDAGRVRLVLDFNVRSGRGKSC
jgi:Fe-S cluster assembly iron-binding protein IscA